MMGNVKSQLSGLDIEVEPVEVTDFWSHHQATIKDSCRYFSLKSDGSVSVFKEQPAIGGPLWDVNSALAKFSNNLLKYRHPCVIHYISNWSVRSTLYLATEYVQPLSQTLHSQTPLQICIGLNNIMRALVFLHERAGMAHNNICVSAIYVTGDGQWKLGGLQYLQPLNDVSATYLKQTRLHRYDKAVDPNEDSYEVTTKVDQYAFAELVEDVFKDKNDEDVPHLKEFKKYCKDMLQHRDPTKRPDLSGVLLHNFFNHEFISIYKFLNFLPVKSEDEKRDFFSNILETLMCYDEETVAKQLGGLLLSRLTMLDQTARKNVVPFILKPKNDRLADGEQTGFFSLGVYKEHVKPRLMQLFGVRDSQIRMVLLTHFSKFIHVFSREELSQHILPELLLGIKDTDDIIVASTLVCLSELVPILGGDSVIGGKRTKLFTDGRPNSLARSDVLLTKKPLHDFHCSEAYPQNFTEIPGFDKSMTLKERPSPLGGESNDEIALTESNLMSNDSENDWSDWESKNHSSAVPSNEHFGDEQLLKSLRTGKLTLESSSHLESTQNSSSNTSNNDSRTHLLHKAAMDAKRNIVDISELDIKNQKVEQSRKAGDELDFFADMMPVIEKAAIANVVEKVAQDFSKLDFVPDDSVEENGAWEDNWNE